MIKRINFIPYNFFYLSGDLTCQYIGLNSVVISGIISSDAWRTYAVLGLELGSPACKTNPSLYHFSNHALYFLLLLLSSEYSKLNIYFYHSLILLYENFDKKLG